MHRKIILFGVRVPQLKSLYGQSLNFITSILEQLIKSIPNQN